MFGNLRKCTAVVVTTAVLLSCSSVSADVTALKIFDGLSNGKSDFGTLSYGSGGIVIADTLIGVTGGATVQRRGFTIAPARPGRTLAPRGTGQSGGTLLGSVSDDGSSLGGQPSGDGVTLTFDEMITALGFEIDDLLDCCDTTSPEVVVLVDDEEPVIFTATDLIIDDTGSDDGGTDFVTIIGDEDGFSEVTISIPDGQGGGTPALGGEVFILTDAGTSDTSLQRTASSVPPVPLPAGGWLLIVALAGFGLVRRQNSA